MLEYKILMKLLFVLNCVFIRCVTNSAWMVTVKMTTIGGRNM